MTNATAIDPQTFRKLTTLIYEQAGIRLDARKEALVSARIGKRMRALSMSSVPDYCRRVEEDRSGAELVELLNVISTNVTTFFREEPHFVLLDKLLRGWEAQGQRRFRIWCAGCATGEEAYSIAMTVREALADPRDARILATDLSTHALGLAKRGAYKPDSVAKVPPSLLNKYFTKETSAEVPAFRVADKLKRMVTFGRLNLAAPPYPLHGPLDIVLCRNVMIYFDNKVRTRVMSELHRLLKEDGYLLVGHAESLAGIVSEFTATQPSVYVKKQGGKERGAVRNTGVLEQGRSDAEQ